MFSRIFAIVITVFSFSGTAHALTVQAKGDFSPGATIEDFSTSNGTTLPAAFGDMTISGRGRVSDIGWGSFYNGNESLFSSSALTLTFSETVTELGFDFGGNRPSSVSVEFFRGTTSLGTQALTFGGFADNTPWVFYGFTDAPGFDRVEFSAEQNRGWTWGLDNFIYGDGSNVTPVPLPAGLPMLAAAVIGLMVMRRRPV